MRRLLLAAALIVALAVTVFASTSGGATTITPSASSVPPAPLKQTQPCSRADFSRYARKLYLHNRISRRQTRKLNRLQSCLAGRDARLAKQLRHRLRKARWARLYILRHGNVGIGRVLAARRGWTGQQFMCLKALWHRESGWRTRAHNPSGAHGIPQALPGSKMGPGWQSNPWAQIRWGLGYIRGRYGTPCGADGFQRSHNWY